MCNERLSFATIVRETGDYLVIIGVWRDKEGRDDDVSRCNFTHNCRRFSNRARAIAWTGTECLAELVSLEHLRHQIVDQAYRSRHVTS